MERGLDHRRAGGNPDDAPTLAVIDDDDRWLKVFERIFRNSGYRLETFSDPRAFLREIGQAPTRYAGVICDIRMPEMDGHEVFNTLKANPATANIPLVLVSGVLSEDNNLYRVQGIAHVSKLDDDLRSRIFDELIEVIENWPRLKAYLHTRQAAEQNIEFFHQFYVNYHLFFSQILDFIRQMEAACVSADTRETDRVRLLCDRFMQDLYERCLDLIDLAQDCPHAEHFVRKICTRARNSLNMLLNFQMLMGHSAATDSDFSCMLTECRHSLEKIIQGSEKGYNLRQQE